MFVYLLQLTRRVIVLVKGGLDSSKAYYSPVVLRSKTKILSFWDPFRKNVRCIEDGKYSKKIHLCSKKMCVIPNVRYIKCTLNWGLFYKDK